MPKKLTISNFTDPMMGLSYESEPFFRKLETHFQRRVTLKFIMSGLVRNVYDFVDPNDLLMGRELALDRYNARLAKIYEDEEYISGMPIKMKGLQLFSTEHTSSIPLNLAYKAAQIVDISKADLFLYNLRYATIVECRPTTRFDEILAVVKRTLIDVDAFVTCYNDGRAQAALDKDFQFRQTLGLRTLPAYLFEYDGRNTLAKGVLNYDDFCQVIEQLTNNEMVEIPPVVSLESVRELVNLHPLISPIEIKYALNLASLGEVKELIKPLLSSGEISIHDVPNGWFIRRVSADSLC
ncbi:DsbA family protein [Pseudomonas sp. CHM02]|uniref:DsbA family protein n=1 Tax=Pseudomonas sp. CHM02 TaxID=1463662 RepID=UPI0009DEE5C5|nr:DsbA family protein [Pseudomonas sp. CHM02]